MNRLIYEKKSTPYAKGGRLYLRGKNKPNMKNDRLYFEGGRFLVKQRGGFFYLCGAIAKAALLL